MDDRRARWISDRLTGGGTGRENRPRILLLCDYRPFDAATVVDHIEAIRTWSRYDVFVLPMLGDLPDELDLDAFDCVVIHYSLVMSFDAYVSSLARWRISRFTGLKAAFIQDEYRFVDDTVAAMGAMGINVLFTCVSQDQVEAVYPHRALPQLDRTVTVLTGYVPDHLVARPVVPYEARDVDVAYRGRILPPWLGRLARQKVEIAERFAADAPAYGLVVDISSREEDRIYGEHWVRFISGAKATLGVESGASVFDFDGSIERAIRDHLAADPGATFAELHERYLAPVDGRIRLNQISPRSFEAAALGTLMVLYPGDYSGILVAGRHYVPLEFDHSNMDEVVAAIRDQETWARVTEAARTEVALNPAHSFRSMVALVDDGLDLPAPTARPAIEPDAFEAIANENVARLQPIHLNATGRPPTIDRLRMGMHRLATGLRPSPFIGSPPPGDAAGRRGRLGRVRGFVRYLRAAAYWIAPPRRLPWRWLARHRTRLLDDLGLLAIMKDQGARAVRTGAGPLFALRVDSETGEATVEHVSRSDLAMPPGPAPQSATPRLTGLAVRLTDPWLVPKAVTGSSPRRLGALSGILRADEAARRRLLSSDPAWFVVAPAATLGVQDGSLASGGHVEVEAE
jgi:hypothetical protein